MKTQKELKALYLKELQTTSTWRRDEHMINYCYNKASLIVELPSGGIYVINKPHIRTDFCFGYSDDYSGEDFDRACEMSQYARTNEGYFMKENLEDLDRWINDLKEARDNESLRTDRGYKLWVLHHEHSGDTDDCIVRGIQWTHPRDAESEQNRLERFGNRMREATKEDIDAIIEGYEESKRLFTKRLTTYLKRFGLSKLHTWTYWRDE